MTDRYYHFPTSRADISEKIKHLRSRAELLGTVAASVDGYSSTLADLYASFAGCLALLAEQLPFKQGDRVTLVKVPKCEGGWAGSKHFLVEGALGTVKMIDVDYLMRRWTVYVSFDDESWIAESDFPPRHKKGDIVSVPEERRHVYGLPPEYITNSHEYR